MTRKRLFHTSRLFRHINKMPTPEDASSRQNPVAETWDARGQYRGLARVDIGWLGHGYDRPFTFFSILKDCGRITHWRWRRP